MSVINTNIGALKAANASAGADKALGTAMERLSTGKRINSAKDDAAGLAIASSMTSQIRGMNQGIRNANDGISLAQTAEGSLNEVSNMLQRVRELAVQSASGTYQTSDRANLQAEVTELKAQIDQVVANGDFNGVALFGGATVTIQAGAKSTDTVDLTMACVVTLDPVPVLGDQDVFLQRLQLAVVVELLPAVIRLGRGGEHLDDQRRVEEGILVAIIESLCATDDHDIGIGQ